MVITPVFPHTALEMSGIVLWVEDIFTCNSFAPPLMVVRQCDCCGCECHKNVGVGMSIDGLVLF